MLRDLGVEVIEERYTHDGSLWTSAGVSAGIDMLLAYIAAARGEAVASAVQLQAEYFPKGGFTEPRGSGSRLPRTSAGSEALAATIEAVRRLHTERAAIQTSGGRPISVAATPTAAHQRAKRR